MIGMGNYARQDDGIGLRVVEHIVDNNLDSTFIAVEAGNDGLSVLNCFSADTEKILIVDCALIDIQPGDYRMFDVDEAFSRKEIAGISTHEGDIMKIVAMGRALGYYMPPIRIFAIQPESLEMDMELSGTLARRMPEYIEKVIKEINS